MVCDKCGEREILYYQNEVEGLDVKCCPKCNCLHLLSKEVSKQISEKQYQYIDEMFSVSLKKFKKTSLIYWLLGYREHLSSQFIFKVPSIKLNELLAVNVLVKKVMQACDENADGIANAKNTEEMISFFDILLQNKEYQSLIDEDFGFFIAKGNFDLEKMYYPELFNNFRFVYDEDWIMVIESFDQSFIMTNEAGEKFLEKHHKEYESAKDNDTIDNDAIDKMDTPEGYIHYLYPLLQSFRVGLTKNKLFEETFSFDYFEDKRVLIDLFRKVSTFFAFKHGLLTRTNKEDFELFLYEEFKNLDQTKLYNDLVYREDNQSVFPLFVELDNYIIISRYFLNLIGIFYHSIYYNDLFRKETESLSQIFEKKDVPNKFHENGFNVRVNMKKKNILEIDTIAWNNNTLYVIESKIWDVRPFFEHRRVHNQRERDLKGIVDGFKYTNEIPKPIPKLTDKVDHIKNNSIQILSINGENECFPDHTNVDFNNIKEFAGIIITKSYPPIKEYKSIKMIGFREIDALCKRTNIEE